MNNTNQTEIDMINAQLSSAKWDVDDEISFAYWDEMDALLSDDEELPPCKTHGTRGGFLGMITMLLSAIINF